MQSCSPGVIGIGFGPLSGSFAIVFDGIYSLTDATMALVALLVSNLIVASSTGGRAKATLVKHFTMGRGHKHRHEAYVQAMHARVMAN